MSLQSLVVAHELRSLVRGRAFVWVLLLIAAALAFAAWSGAQSVARERHGAQVMAQSSADIRERLHDGLVRYEQRMAETGRPVQVAVYSHSPRGPIPQGTNAGSVGLKSVEPAILPPTGLAAFAVGQSDILLSYIPINTETLVNVLQDNELGNPLNLLRGAFDISFVVIFLLPIFILAISYDMLSSEHERGTLAMVLSHPVTLRKLMTSKLISRAMIVIGVVLAMGLVSLFFVGEALASVDTWMRFGIWLAATLLYSLFWFALAVLVNALGRNSATNGIVLAGAWLVLVVVAPTIVSAVATTAYPAPSRFEFITASRAAQTDAERNYMAALNEYYFDHVEYAPDGAVSDFLAVTRAKNEAVERAVGPLYARFRSQLANQDRIVGVLQYVSPAIMMQRALNDASGASAARYAHYIDQVETFHDQWISYFTTRFLSGQPLRSSEYATFPHFQYQEESAATVLWRAAPALLGILVLTLIAALVGFTALRRYQVAAR
jgi:ABC-2 type transport system permease protein